MSSIRSMTGYASVESDIRGRRIRVELRSLNHRFLDLKVRLPKELQPADFALRQELQNRFSRGSIECKVEFLGAEGSDESAREVHPNLSLAAQYFEALNSIQKTVGLTDELRTVDIAQFPEVIQVTAADPFGTPGATDPEKLWAEVRPGILKGCEALTRMRETEGAALSDVLRRTMDDIRTRAAAIRDRRAECQEEYRSRVSERIRSVFETYPVEDAGVRTVLETRIAQELAMLLDRTDIEEELNRLAGHLDHFLQTLEGGSPVGRKLDFLLQEINREVNTLGNKAQDLPISGQVVELKVAVEQLREQVMNLE